MQIGVFEWMASGWKSLYNEKKKSLQQWEHEAQKVCLGRLPDESDWLVRGLLEAIKGWAFYVCTESKTRQSRAEIETSVKPLTSRDASESMRKWSVLRFTLLANFQTSKLTASISPSKCQETISFVLFPSGNGMDLDLPFQRNSMEFQ